MKSHPKQVFLLLTNRSDKTIIDLFNTIEVSTHDLGSTCLVYHSLNQNIPDEVGSINHFSFDNSILHAMGYQPFANSLIPGSNHFPLLDFFLKNPGYDFYWYIEDDVRFTGDWKYFFDFFTQLSTQPDFLSSHIRTSQEEVNWDWFVSLKHPTIYLPHFLKIRSFNPIIRISNAALKCIHDMLIQKWSGHHEVLIPTLLYLEGFDIKDFGGVGKFVMPDFENKFYLGGEPDSFGLNRSGSMRYRPLITEENKIENMLYHPVKV